MRQAVSTPSAPPAIGPYSQAIRAGSLLFVSGQIPLDPATGNLVEGDLAAQTHRVFQNLESDSRRRRRDVRQRRPNDRLSGGHERFPGDERGVRDLLLVAGAGAGDGAGRASTQGRARRNRSDRFAWTLSALVSGLGLRLIPGEPVASLPSARHARHPAHQRRSSAT